MNKKKVILLNPPADELYLRDYYCSKVSKSNYVYPPVDLVVLSGILNAEFELVVIDAIVRRLSDSECLDIIDKAKADALIFLTGAVSRNNDFAFMRLVKERSNIPLIGTGDLFLEEQDKFFKNEEWLDGIIMDFTDLSSVIYRDNLVVFTGFKKQASAEFSIPVPRHDLFMDKRYSYPFVRRMPFATVLTDYACPFKCKFCLSATLKYKYRSVDNVMDELLFLNSSGFRDIYFADQTFGANKKRTLELCERMKALKRKFGWVCFSRVDITDEEFISAMKEAGCHTIIYGIESGNDKILESLGKGIKREQIIKAFGLCKKYKISTVGTFILGFPEENESDIRETVKFAKEIGCDYASFNVLVPRARTEIKESLKESGTVDMKSIEEMDQSGSYTVLGTKYLTKEEVKRLRDQAIRDFFYRPSYLAKRALEIRSFWDIKRLFGGGFSLLKEKTNQDVKK